MFFFENFTIISGLSFHLHLSLLNVKKKKHQTICDGQCQWFCFLFLEKWFCWLIRNGTEIKSWDSSKFWDLVKFLNLCRINDCSVSRILRPNPPKISFLRSTRSKKDEISNNIFHFSIIIIKKILFQIFQFFFIFVFRFFLCLCGIIAFVTDSSSDLKIDSFSSSSSYELYELRLH